MIRKFAISLGGSAATGKACQARQVRRFAKALRNWGARSFRTGAWMSCFSLWFAAALLPAMSEELLNVSYDPTRELYTEIKDLFAERDKSRTGVRVTFEPSHSESSKQARSVIFA